MIRLLIPLLFYGTPDNIAIRSEQNQRKFRLFNCLSIRPYWLSLFSDRPGLSLLTRNVARIFYFCLKGTDPVPLCLRQQEAWARRFHSSSLETGHLRAPSDLHVPGLSCRTVPDAGRICPPHACLRSCHFRLPALILWCEFPRTFLPLVRRPEKLLSRTLRGQSSRQRQGQSCPATSDCAAFCAPPLATLQPF